MDGQAAAAAQARRGRKRAARAPAGGSTSTIAAPASSWPAAETVRAPHHDTVNTVNPSNTTFAATPQQLDRSHHQSHAGVVADSDALMNGYTTAAHSTSFADPSSSLTHASSDVAALNGAHHQQPSQHPHPQRHSAATANTDRVLFYSGSPATPSTAAAAAAAVVTPSYNLPSSWTNPTTNTPSNNNTSTPHNPPAAAASATMPQSPAPSLAPPPEGIYRSFEDLLTNVQRVAKDQGYGVVKLRASNYRDGKPTRYDLVCDRGGVKYNSTAKKRNPSTRKVDCPWRAKAVCEVQLGNQWRFAVQEARHNHEPRLPTAPPGQENTPIAQSIRSMANKIDRIAHDMSQGFNRIEATLAARLDAFDKRLEVLEGGGTAGGRGAGILGGQGTPNMGGTPSMPPANMGGAGLGNGSLTNGGLGPAGAAMVDNRLSNLEARINVVEQRSNGMDGLPMMDEESRQLASMVM